MGTYNPQHFRNSPLLRLIGTALLVRFFAQHRDYLNSRGADLPEIENHATLNYDRLHSALLAPADHAPNELAEALYLIDEIANEEGIEALREEVRTKLPTFAIVPQWQDAEFAIAVWLQNARVVEDAHARIHAFKQKRFFTWGSAADFIPDLPEDLDGVIARIASRLEALFLDADSHRHGAGQPTRRFRLFHYLSEEHPGTVRFLIRHAGKLQNAPSVNDQGDSYLALFRPEIYDVVLFVHDRKELKIHAGSKLEQRLYAQVFGEKLCGDADTFSETGNYTLEPLREGPESLSALDVAGISRVRLVEIAFDHGGEHNEYEIRRATDLFATSYYLDHGFPQNVKIDRAIFRFTLAHSKKVRKISIKPPRTAVYTRDTDGLIVERWLQARGFSQPIAAEGAEDVDTAAQEA
jgi:hypothetical protein